MSDPAKPTGWERYLDPGERVLWQGAPQLGLRLKISDIPLSLFGCVFGGFAIFWMTMASSTAGSGRTFGPNAGPADFLGGIFPLFGLPFLVVGAYLAFGRYFWQAYVRGNTRYALTNKRGFVATNAWGRKLKSWLINPGTSIEYQPGSAATLYFAEEHHRGQKGRRHRVKWGFEYIADGDEVYRLMRQVQQGTLPDAGGDGA